MKLILIYRYDIILADGSKTVQNLTEKFVEGMDDEIKKTITGLIEVTTRRVERTDIWYLDNIFNGGF